MSAEILQDIFSYNITSFFIIIDGICECRFNESMELVKCAAPVSRVISSQFEKQVVDSCVLYYLCEILVPPYFNQLT
jgi:hypothetical protein